MSEPATLHVDLDRQFSKLESDLTTQDDATNSYLSLAGDSGKLRWPALLEHRLAVILGEPGSGKTWEFRQQARILSESQHPAFFVPLDRLKSNTIADLLSPIQRLAFESWQRQPVEDGFFFFDSVDEAKFGQVSDFYMCLERIVKDLGLRALTHSRIYLSGRVSEWQPATDAAELHRALTCYLPSDPNETSGSSRRSPLPLVVRLEPLDPARVESFARAKGIREPEAFIRALSAHHAWDFARRPADVIDLANSWQDGHSFVSLTEIMERSVERNLRAAERDVGDPLSPGDARLGAEALAAAVMFCRNFTFLVPDANCPSFGSLDAEAVLPRTWAKQNVRALLRRPLFDGAAYGRVRFHHRRVVEYLAAKWLDKQMHEGCALDALNDLLFDETRGNRVIRRSLEPVAAWLCGGHVPHSEHVRRWVCASCPDIHLRYGDPKALSLEYKRNLLVALSQQSSGRQHTWLVTSRATLARVAEPGLSTDVSRIILNRSLSVDLRAAMVQAAESPELRSCMAAALQVFESDDEVEDLKLYALYSIAETRDLAVLDRLAAIVDQLPNISNGIAGLLCRALYPNVWNIHQLFQAIRKITDLPAIDREGNWRLSREIEPELHTETCFEFLCELTDLLQSHPHLVDDGIDLGISVRYQSLGALLPTATSMLLGKASLSSEEITVLTTALLLLGKFRWHTAITPDDKSDTLSLLEQHQEVKQALFWRIVDDHIVSTGHTPDVFHVSRHLYDHSFLRRADLKWLLENARSRPDANDRELALRAAIAVWKSDGRRFVDYRRISRTLRADPNISNTCRHELIAAKWLPARRLIWPLQRWWWNRRKWRLRQYLGSLRERILLFRNLFRLASGSAVGLLVYLSRDAGGSNHSLWTPQDWEGLVKKRGRIIAWAVQRGCKRSWRAYRPPLPHQRPNPSQIERKTIIGLVGIQRAIEDGDLDFGRLSRDEATTLAHYTLNELNGFAPWLPKLAAAQEKVVKATLCECIRADWQRSRTDASPEVIARLLWCEGNLLPLVHETIVELLTEGDPFDLGVLSNALTLAMGHRPSSTSALAEIARNRLMTLQPDAPSFITWIGVCLQLDAQTALACLEAGLRQSRDPNGLMVDLCSFLSGRFGHRMPLLPDPDYLRPEILESFIPLVYRHVRTIDDVRHRGAYSPDARDDAQRFRDSLLDRLEGTLGGNASRVLRRLCEHPELLELRDWLLHKLDECLKREADSFAWEERDVREFSETHEAEPRTDHALFAMARRRMLDIKRSVETSDNPLRDELRIGDRESSFRRWLARKLNGSSRGRYTVPEEAVVDLDQRPDIRFENPGTAPISVEVKWADSWTLSELLERLENQLVGQYLRAHNYRYGIYVLGMIGKKQHWDHHQEARRCNFDEVVSIVKARAAELKENRIGVEGLEVVGLDFRAPATKS